MSTSKQINQSFKTKLSQKSLKFKLKFKVKMSTEIVNEFNGMVLVSEQLNRMLINSTLELTQKAVAHLAEKYNFDAKEAITSLHLETVKLERKTGKTGEKRASKPKIPIVKPAFPLPYNGEFNANYCYALRQNNGLYTQCLIPRKNDKSYCKSCQSLADKNIPDGVIPDVVIVGVPEYGTIQQRMECDIFNYVDPKGRKPVAYTKVMKKYKLTEEQVQSEAGKFNITINANHFIIPESKRGRPAKETAPKEPKGAKGRPKKAKKVLEVEGGDADDLFTILVANATTTEAEDAEEDAEDAEDEDAEDDEEEEISETVTDVVTEPVISEKDAKEAKRIRDKAEKEIKLAADKEAKAAAKAAAKKIEDDAKAAAKKIENDAKAAAKALRDAAKPAKAVAKPTAIPAPIVPAPIVSAPVPAAAPAAIETEEEEEVVKVIKVNGVKYLKSKKSGVIYDYQIYTATNEQHVIGQWNDTTKTIDFTNDEESEEEYEEDD
jgi:chemotaxis protein histidine kinase CheA